MPQGTTLTISRCHFEFVRAILREQILDAANSAPHNPVGAAVENRHASFSTSAPYIPVIFSREKPSFT